MYAAVSGLLSVVALVLATTGVYGPVVFTVTQRSHDLAIRVAVGADTMGLQRMVVGRSLALAGVGILAGVVLALATMRVAVSLLFMDAPADPTVYAISAIIMTAVVVLASYLPARSIVHLHPMPVLGRG